MTDLVLTAVASEVARTTNDILRASATAGLVVFTREGTSPHVLGWLASSTAELIPKPSLITTLAISHNLEGKWKSPFMANLMGVQQTTTQLALLQVDAGQKLVLYVTALAAAATSTTVRGILREYLALTLGLSQVAEVPKNVYYTCVHASTLQILQPDIATNFDLNGILTMHSVDDFYNDTTSATAWERVAPHHMLRLRSNPIETVYLSFRNDAGRKLALSRVGDAQSSAVVHFGVDYRRALSHTERFGCDVVILRADAEMNIKIDCVKSIILKYT